MSIFEFADQLGFNPPIVFEDDVVSEEGVYNDVIDFDKLAKTIGKYRAFQFDYREYISKKTSTISTNGLDGTEPQSYEIHIPLIVNDPEKGERALQLSGVLNKKKGKVSRNEGNALFSFKLDASKRAISYIKKIKYETSNEIAIRVETPFYEDYILLSEIVKTRKNKEVDALIIREFNEAFRNVKDNATLKWLYEKAPLFVLKQREDQLLLNDLNVLLFYDLDSWFIDSSTAMMKLLRGFTDSKIAYDFFNENPDEAIRVYKAMSDGSREQFTMLLTTLSYIYSGKERHSSISFTIGKNYTLDSNIFLEKNQKEILLQQYVYEYKSVEVESAFESGSTFVKTRKSVLVTQTVNQFHPLDMVTLKDEITGDTELVCALHVKLLSDRAEWQNVITTVTIVVTVVAIIASVGVLAAGATGVAATIAVLEIVVGIGDLIHILKRANLDGTEEGNWFEKNWEKISATTAVISIGSALHQGLVKNGPKVLGRLRGIRNPASRSIQQRIEGLLITIQIELFFTFKGVALVGIEPFTIILKNFGIRFASKMRSFGVLLTTPVEGSKGIRALVYKGEKIAEGTKKELKVTLKEIFPHGAKDGDVIKYLDELVDVAKSLTPIKSIDELILFLGKINSNYKAVDLEKTGIRALFRGTTRVDGKLFPGNTNSQLSGLSTSTDPIRAIIFAIESASIPGSGRKGFLQIISPKELKNIFLNTPVSRFRYKFELEVVLDTSAKNLSNFVVKEIPVIEARELANKFFNINLDTKIDKNTSDLLLKEIPKTSLEEAYNFFESLLKL